MKSLIIAAVLFSTGHPVVTEHRIEVITPSRLLLGLNCDPDFGFGPTGGGTIVGRCNLVTSQVRPPSPSPDVETPQSKSGTQPKSYGGGSVVQLASFPGFTFTNCQTMELRRIVHPPADTLYSFTCEEELP